MVACVGIPAVSRQFPRARRYRARIGRTSALCSRLSFGIRPFLRHVLTGTHRLVAPLPSDACVQVRRLAADVDGARAHDAAGGPVDAERCILSGTGQDTARHTRCSKMQDARRKTQDARRKQLQESSSVRVENAEGAAWARYQRGQGCHGCRGRCGWLAFLSRGCQVALREAGGGKETITANPTTAGEQTDKQTDRQPGRRLQSIPRDALYYGQ